MIPSRPLFGLAACIATTVAVRGVAAQCKTLDEVDITASDAAAGHRFGLRVSAGGGRIAVGVRSDDEVATDAGAVYVLIEQKGAWVEEQKITAFDGAGFDFFGGAVALDGATLAIGATGDDDRGFATGAVYIYTLENAEWTFRTKVLGVDTEAGDQFGHDVALDGGRLAVGVARDDDLGMFAGAAYVFTGAGAEWVQEQKLTAPGGVEGDGFGTTVALDGDVLAAGAPSRDLFSVNDGSVYVFERAVDADGPTWSWKATFEPTDKMSVGTGLGSAIDVRGGLLAAGGPGADLLPFVDVGMLFIAERINGAWTSAAELTDPNPFPGGNLGAAVRVITTLGIGSGSGAVAVGGPNYAPAGRVNIVVRPEYRFDRVDPSTQHDRRFGSALDVILLFLADGVPTLRLIVGDPGYDVEDDMDVGAVTVVDLTCSSDCVPDLDGSGAVDFGDIVAILAVWGASGGPEDLDGSGVVDFGDIVVILGAWGPCA